MVFDGVFLPISLSGDITIFWPTHFNFSADVYLCDIHVHMNYYEAMTYIYNLVALFAIFSFMSIASTAFVRATWDFLLHICIYAMLIHKLVILAL